MTRQCSVVEGEVQCERPGVARGLCTKHYANARYHNELGAFGKAGREKKPKPLCSVPNCGRPQHVAQGLCAAHYSRSKRGGAIDRPVRQLKPRAAREEIDRFLEVASANREDNCLRWPYAAGRSGYGKVLVDGRLVGAHVEICRRAHGPPPTAGMYVTHSCGKGHEGCVAPRHLSYGTPLQNSADAKRHGTTAVGEHKPLAKLTEAAVQLIRAGGASDEYWAEKFGVSARVVASVRVGAAWKHIEGRLIYDHAKLDAEMVRAIRTDPRSPCELSEVYGVSPRTIRDARNRITWKHVT